VVWQWANTDHGAQGAGNEPVTGKVLKGGSWHQRNLADNRAAVRRYAPSDFPDDATGFRCAKSTVAWPDADLWVNHR
jgi:formylglycine-generating enzyme required for sulfatase activity